MHRNNIGGCKEIIDRENVAVGHHQPTPNKGASTSVRKQAFGDLKNVIHNQTNGGSLVKVPKPESKPLEASNTIERSRSLLKKRDIHNKTIWNDEVTWIENSGIDSFWTEFEKTIQSTREQKKTLLKEKVKQIEKDHIILEEEAFINNLNKEHKNIKIGMSLEKLPQLKAPVLPKFRKPSFDDDEFLNW